MLYICVAFWENKNACMQIYKARLAWAAVGTSQSMVLLYTMNNILINKILFDFGRDEEEDQ